MMDGTKHDLFCISTFGGVLAWICVACRARAYAPAAYVALPTSATGRGVWRAPPIVLFPV